MANIKIQRENNTKVNGIVSKTFAKRANLFGTPEFKEWMEFVKYFPDAEMKIEASRSRHSDGETKKEKVNTKNLTYANMRLYINSLDLSSEKQKAALEEFENVKKRSRIQPNPYKYVREWFATKYPKYHTFLAEVESNEETNEEKANA